MFVCTLRYSYYLSYVHYATHDGDALLFCVRGVFSALYVLNDIRIKLSASVIIVRDMKHRLRAVMVCSQLS